MAGMGTGILERRIQGHDVVIDGREATISAEVPENVAHEDDSSSQEEIIYTNPARLLRNGATPSFSIIRFAKVKNFIDGVHSAVEFRVNEKGHRLSRGDFLDVLEKELSGDAKTYVNNAVSGNTNNDVGLSLPQGFYDWNSQLRKAYRQIKVCGVRPGFFFGDESDDSVNGKVMGKIREAINGNAQLGEQFNSITELYAKMTNKPDNVPCLFPAAILPDQEYFKNLSFARQGDDLPEGLGKVLVEAVRDGRVSFVPDEKSGLYIWQMNEITPLVKRDTREFEKYTTNEQYNKILENEFISQWVGTRHTHVGHTDFRDTLCTCCVQDTPIEIPIFPELEVEPFSTSYSRMQRSVEFLEQVVKANVPEVFDRKRLMGQEEISKKTIGEEFEEMKLLLKGLELISLDSLHIPYRIISTEDNEAVDSARKWMKNASSDSDIDRNCAIFVPIIRTADRSRFVSYIDAGFKTFGVSTSYADKPQVKINSPKREIGFLRGGVYPFFSSKEYTFPALVHREVRVPYNQLINDSRFRGMLKSEFSERDLDAAVKRLES